MNILTFVVQESEIAHRHLIRRKIEITEVIYGYLCHHIYLINIWVSIILDPAQEAEVLRIMVLQDRLPITK